MPELPEVETIKNELEDSVLNKQISNIEVLLERSIINHTDTDINQILGKITNIKRFGKFITISIDEKFLIAVHLRMTGKLIYNPFKITTESKSKYTRIIFWFNDNTCLFFDDVRTFGKVEIYPFCIDIIKEKKLGIDALDEKFNKNLLQKIVKNKSIPIKVLLLDQTLIAGIGNIYAQEILFDTNISPTRKSCSLDSKELFNIVESSKKILRLAIKHNGTSISDFRRVDDKTGEFQNFLKIYGKKNCPVCESEIVKIKQGGRSTSYCKICQK